MKRIVGLLVLAISGLFGAASFANAQGIVPDDRYQGYPRSLIQWPKELPNLQTCRDGEYYEPLDVHLVKYASRVKVAGSRTQNQDECRWMLTARNPDRWRYVMRPIGTVIFVDGQGRDLFDGGSGGKVCMNPSPFGFVVEPEKEVPPTKVVLSPEAAPTAPEPPSVPQRVAPPPPDVLLQESGAQWGFTASAMLGEFKSIPIGGIVDGIAGRTVCVEGRTLDIGFARGGPASSFWRFTFAGRFFDEGSFTQYTCPDCNQDVKTVAASGVRVLGLQVERVVRIKTNSRWPIQPMVSVYIGGGRISGRATQHTGPVGGVATSSQIVGAREMFGSSWFPTAGAGIGVVGDLGRHLTYAVTVAGIEYPGIYYGRVSLTYWPK